MIPTSVDREVHGHPVAEWFVGPLLVLRIDHHGGVWLSDDDFDCGISIDPDALLALAAAAADAALTILRKEHHRD